MLDCAAIRWALALMMAMWSPGWCHCTLSAIAAPAAAGEPEVSPTFEAIHGGCCNRCESPAPQPMQLAVSCCNGDEPCTGNSEPCSCACCDQLLGAMSPGNAMTSQDSQSSAIALAEPVCAIQHEGEFAIIRALGYGRDGPKLVSGVTLLAQRCLLTI